MIPFALLCALPLFLFCLSATMLASRLDQELEVPISASDRPASDRPASDRPASDRSASDRSASDRYYHREI